jgi:hypothetical protein
MPLLLPARGLQNTVHDEVDLVLLGRYEAARLQWRL